MIKMSKCQINYNDKILSSSSPCASLVSAAWPACRPWLASLIATMKPWLSGSNLVGIVDNCSSAAPKAADMAVSLLSILVARRCLAGCLLSWTMQGGLVLYCRGRGGRGRLIRLKGKYCKALNPLTLAHPICYRPAQALGVLDPEPLAGALHKFVHACMALPACTVAQYECEPH